MREVRAHRSVRAIAERDWSALEVRHLFESRSWLAANEATLTGEPIVTAAWEDGALHSVLVWQASAVSEPSPYYNIGALVARWQGETASATDGWTLSCTGVGAHSPVLVAPRVRLDAGVLDDHVDAAARTREVRPWMVGVNFLAGSPVSGAEEALRAAGFELLHGYQRAELSLPGSAYDDYLAALDARKRWNARRDRRRFAESGQVVTTATGPAAMGEDVVALQGRNKTKYGQAFDADETRRRYTDLLDCAGDDGLVVRSWKAGTCTGFALFFRDRSTLHALAAGFAEPEGPAGPYFECLFHAPIDWAYENGIDRIDYGIGAVAAKAGRGCTVRDQATWFRRT